MIVTLATQIIFRGISRRSYSGSGGSISSSKYGWFPCNRQEKSEMVPYILFLVVILVCNLRRNLRQEHIWTSCICNRYQPSYSILFRCPCTERSVSSSIPVHGYSFRTVRSYYSLSSFHTVQTQQPVTDLKWMPSQWQYSEVSPLAGGKGTYRRWNHLRICHHRLPACRSWSD